DTAELLAQAQLDLALELRRPVLDARLDAVASRREMIEDVLAARVGAYAIIGKPAAQKAREQLVRAQRMHARVSDWLTALVAHRAAQPTRRIELGVDEHRLARTQTGDDLAIFREGRGRDRHQRAIAFRETIEAKATAGVGRDRDL